MSETSFTISSIALTHDYLFSKLTLIILLLKMFCAWRYWHLVLYPKQDGILPQFMRWLTMTHTQRWHVAHDTAGTGHLYQGRYKSFPVETETYLYTVLRYVERNALRVNLVARADQWRWGSVWVRAFGSAEQKKVLSTWPVEEPADYIEWVNEPQTDEEEAAIRRSVNRGQPFGSEAWQKDIIQKFNLQATVQRRGGYRRKGL
ncbi:MAG: transposase [Candidatus Vogelbacteria bacterium]|nr:transposase [Candidatus Vogelbacteria bacterium]